MQLVDARSGGTGLGVRPAPPLLAPRRGDRQLGAPVDLLELDVECTVVGREPVRLRPQRTGVEHRHRADLGATEAVLTLGRVTGGLVQQPDPRAEQVALGDRLGDGRPVGQAGDGIRGVHRHDQLPDPLRHPDRLVEQPLRVLGGLLALLDLRVLGDAALQLCEPSLCVGALDQCFGKQHDFFTSPRGE